MTDGMDLHSPESGLFISPRHTDSFDRSYGSTQFHSSVLYGGRTYQSASQALEAYIDNFERKLVSSRGGTNKLHLGSSSKPFSSSPHRQKEVFRDQHSFRDLCLPSRSLRRRIASDPDLASLTTDDLLGMPPDGSLPLTRASVLQTQTQQHLGSQFNHSCSYTFQNLLQRSLRNILRIGITREMTALHCFVGKLDIVHQTEQLASNNLDFHLGTVPRERDRYMTHSVFPSLPVNDCRFGKQKHDSIPQHNYPRWLTSQKAELDVSGITSIPDLKYPGWLQDCDLGSDSCDQEALNEREYLLSTRYKTELPGSRLYSSSARYVPKHKHFGNYLERDPAFHKHTELGFSGTLRRTPPHTTRFAHCNTKEVEDSHRNKPFRDDHIDLLIHKAEHALEILSQHMTSPEQNLGSPGTEEVLEADRSWDNPPVTFKSPVPVGNNGEDCFEASNPALIDNSHQDFLNTGHQRNLSGLSGISGGKHHGPVEALKQMLFSLQTVQQSLDDECTEEQEIRKISENIMSQTHGLDFEEASGSKSLQRALNHLRHLKELVDDIGAKMEKETGRNQYQ
ncbi:LOW QUALITY PROTEIN: lung adenoma susceptibility protein 2 [Scyliorhinus canicula]|uniref:LOW QUALITY PROTEIN: lung adenoma susceptibility protein 2 n=1 Tax=Scyliorhinus canicula TaxID=7830 RepID=UPI0018F525F8|nr:LOW QUALITY PROTEIN: lung adenoma susceptibility protein 2 [Scyliorhinus canicula]